MIIRAECKISLCNLRIPPPSHLSLLTRNYSKAFIKLVRYACGITQGLVFESVVHEVIQSHMVSFNLVKLKDILVT